MVPARLKVLFQRCKIRAVTESAIPIGCTGEPWSWWADVFSVSFWRGFARPLSTELTISSNAWRLLEVFSTLEKAIQTKCGKVVCLNDLAVSAGGCSSHLFALMIEPSALWASH